MKELTRILTLNSGQICSLLENHKMFSDDEVKLAAKMKVKNDKKTTSVMPSLRNPLDHYYGQMQNAGLSGFGQYNNRLF